MFSHLLVPLDGSSLAETALSAASFLARVLRAKVTLLHIVERAAPSEIHGERHLTTSAEAHKYLESVVRSFFSDAPEIQCRVMEEESAGVARRIQEYASLSGSDLIVMCTHGQSGLRHLLSGSNAQQVVGCGGIPVLQVRPHKGVQHEFSCRKVLAPLDGKAEHEQGLAAAALLARTFNAELQILLVVPTRQTLRGESAVAARLSPRATSALLDISLREAHEYIQRRVELLRKEGMRATGRIERGEAAKVILQIAERRETDLIVLGTHRKAGADAFWSGSVAPKVTNSSPVPVLLIPLRESDQTGNK